MIYYRSTAGMGRGVFAGRRFECGELIERVPVIVIPGEQADLLATTVLDAYDFDWQPQPRQSALALGHGSLYNHSFAPNARYQRLLASEEMEFFALRAIEADEEILINYNGESGDTRRMVFDGQRWWREG